MTKNLSQVSGPPNKNKDMRKSKEVPAIKNLTTIFHKKKRDKEYNLVGLMKAKPYLYT